MSIIRPDEQLSAEGAALVRAAQALVVVDDEAYEAVAAIVRAAKADATGEGRKNQIVELVEEWGAAIVRAAQALVVVDDATYVEAGERRKTAKQFIALVEEWGRPIVAEADRAHKVALAQLRRLTEPATEADTIYKRGRMQYEAVQAAMQFEAEQAVARERARLEREAQAAGVEATRLRVLAEEERRLAAAAAAEARGDHEAAERIIAEPITAPVVTPALVFVPPPVDTTPPAVEGITSRTDWDFEIVEPFAVPRAYLQIDEKAIRAVVRALKAQTHIPGVRVFPRRSEFVRLRRR